MVGYDFGYLFGPRLGGGFNIFRLDKIRGDGVSDTTLKTPSEIRCHFKDSMLYLTPF